MKSPRSALYVLAGLSLIFALAAVAQKTQASRPASPIYGVTLPDGYPQWQLIAPSHEGAPLNELRAVVGNAVAIKAYEDRTLPFPDGAVLAKLAWKHVPSTEFAPAFIPGAPTTVQIMVKDSKKYAASGGWGFGRFVAGKPAAPGTSTQTESYRAHLG
ncbi:MAG: cytochrome P460 family protein [Devosia sp.]